MLNSTWAVLSAVSLVGGALVILAPNFMVSANKHLSHVLLSVDDLLMRYRHLVGVVLLVVAYLCFRLALFLPGAL